MVFFQSFFAHYPSRLLRAGFFLFFGFFLATALLFSFFKPVHFPFTPPQKNRATESTKIFSLQAEHVESHPFEVPNIEGEFSISLNPPIPNREEDQSVALLQLKNGGGARIIALPGKVGLSFNDFGSLQFSERENLFWVELITKDTNRFEGKIAFLSDGGVFSRSFLKEAEQPPLQKIEQFPSESALYSLTDARWRGADLLTQTALKQEIQKIELGPTMISLSREEFLTFKSGNWVKTDSPEQLPLVRIRSVVGNSLECDSWDENTVYRRFAIPLQAIQAGPPPKMEELFSSWRIRSEKQISCMLEKQSFLIRVGDWVLKEQGRWRVIRTQEEREKVLSGQRAGDLLILEKVDQKLKSAKGRFIAANRLQAVAFDFPALHLKAKKELQKGRAK